LANGGRQATLTRLGNDAIGRFNLANDGTGARL
jgi:hypothetical protein